MKSNYRKEKKLNEKATIDSLSPLLISSTEEIVINKNNYLATTPYDEDSDEEWLKEKHRILDARNAYRKLLATQNTTIN